MLDYLTVEGYRDAAEEFVRESGVLSLREPEGEGGAAGLDDGERPLDPEAIEVCRLRSIKEARLNHFLLHRNACIFDRPSKAAAWMRPSDA